MLEFDDVQASGAGGANIKVIGVGGGGGNAINTMIGEGLDGVEFIAANTDLQALERNLAPIKIQLGNNLTKGLGAGANPEIGRNAALEDQTRIAEVLAGADMVFVTAGMGGGTGTGAAPVIAQVAREQGALTVGVMTKPFMFEGARRRRSAETGLEQLQESVDTLITIPNQRLLAIAGENMSIIDAFRRADEVLLHAVQGITDLITIGGYVNVDFADVKTIMSNMGMALMGTGRASGPSRAREAAEMAISSPLLEDVSIHGATGILLNVTGGPDLALMEINEASTLIQEAAHEDANIIFGAVIDEEMRDEIKITVIATGFDRAVPEAHQVHMAHAQVPQQHYQQPPVQHQPVQNHPHYVQPAAQRPQPVQAQPAQAQPAPRPAQQQWSAPSEWGYQPTAQAAPQPPQPVAPVRPQPPTPQPQAAPAVAQATATASTQSGARRPHVHSPATGARRGGLSPMEEDELAIPTFLRNTKNSSQH
jgi:cell division protein FtsZ